MVSALVHIASSRLGAASGAWRQEQLSGSRYRLQLVRHWSVLVCRCMAKLQALHTPPSGLAAAQVENVGAALRNMQHLCNLLRPTQVRAPLQWLGWLAGLLAC